MAGRILQIEKAEPTGFIDSNNNKWYNITVAGRAEEFKTGSGWVAEQVGKEVLFEVTEKKDKNGKTYYKLNKPSKDTVMETGSTSSTATVSAGTKEPINTNRVIAIQEAVKLISSGSYDQESLEETADIILNYIEGKKEPTLREKLEAPDEEIDLENIPF